MGRWLGALILVAVIAFAYPVASALLGVPPLYNHPLSAKLLYGYYFKTERQNLPGYFFRFTSKFIHDGDEEMVFDTVVACNTQVSSSRAAGRSVLHGIAPNVFAQRTRTNNAVLVVTPELCGKAQRGLWNQVREKFIPIVIWFEKADDLSFGLAYVSEDAYESPKSHLKFVSASVGPATRKEWEEWRKTRPENLVKPEMVKPALGAPKEMRARYLAFNPNKKYL